MSQFNIDDFVLSVFDKPGFFLETGSSHPTDQNNTYKLEQLGWSGLLVEPRILHNEEYKNIRPNSIIENYALVDKSYMDETIKVYESEHYHMHNVSGIWQSVNNTEWPVSTLDRLLRKHDIRTIDFFSLDVEGYEHEVLGGIDFNFVKFGLIVIETHDYTWNNKNEDFSYLKEFGYSYLKNLSNNHQVWISDNLRIV